MTQICRTCLEEIGNSDFLSLNDESSKLKDELVACVPELDLNLIPNAAMCVYCANSLHAAYDFKQKCLQTEEKILNHKQCTKALDLVQIKQEPESCEKKFDVVHGVGIGMEVIFIREDDTASEDGENQIKTHSTEVLGYEEPITSFLKIDDNELNSKVFPVGLSVAANAQNNVWNTQNNIKSNGKAHPVKKKKIKSVKKELKKSCDPPYIPKHGIMQINKPKTHNGGKCFKCDVCSYTTLREYFLKQHKKTHITLKRYRCSQCNYQTSYKQCLQNHMKNCVQSLTPIMNFREAKSFKCTQCNFRSSQKQTLDQHIKQNHVTEKNLKCDKCSYEASNLSTFKRHLSSHAPEKSLKCDKCDFLCNDLLVMRAHMASSHKLDKSYKCKFCNYRTEYQGAMANHVLTHTGEKRYACTQCEYKAIQKGNLKNHMKHHSSNGKYKCTMCSYGAAVSGNVQKHMRMFHKRRKH